MKTIISVILTFIFSSAIYSQTSSQSWLTNYNGSANGSDAGNFITYDSQGNLDEACFSDGTGTAQDIVTIKYNSAGVQQWASRFNGTANNTDFPKGIAVDGSGNVYVGGSTFSSGGSLMDYVILKYNPAGVLQWTGYYN